MFGGDFFHQPLADSGIGGGKVFRIGEAHVAVGNKGDGSGELGVGDGEGWSGLAQQITGRKIGGGVLCLERGLEEENGREYEGSVNHVVRSPNHCGRPGMGYQIIVLAWRVGEAIVREKANGLGGAAVDGEVGEDFTHGDLRMMGMETDYEVFVGSECVHAGDSAHERTVELWNEGLEMAADLGYVGVSDFAIDI